jgi:hypothetical protein
MPTYSTVRVFSGSLKLATYDRCTDLRVQEGVLLISRDPPEGDEVGNSIIYPLHAFTRADSTLEP